MFLKFDLVFGFYGDFLGKATYCGAQSINHENIYDVAWFYNCKQDANGKLQPVVNTVDLSSARYTDDIGAAQLAAVWTDPDFKADQRAFYYVRVLQIPTPRSTLFDALALEMDAESTTGHPPTIQERAYSSSIWYNPL